MFAIEFIEFLSGGAFPTHTCYMFAMWFLLGGGRFPTQTVLRACHKASAGRFFLTKSLLRFAMKFFCGRRFLGNKLFACFSFWPFRVWASGMRDVETFRCWVQVCCAGIEQLHQHVHGGLASKVNKDSFLRRVPGRVATDWWRLVCNNSAY